MRRKRPFEISAVVIKQLGEQLISDELTALMELVKNAFDADASYARIVVDLENKHPAASHPAPGFILIEDDGTGMDETDIEQGWLVISLSSKREMKRRGELTPKHGRTPLGDKGLGRLSAQRLGSRLDMVSVKERVGPNQLSLFATEQYRVSVNWDEFHEQELLSKVEVTIDDSPRDPNRRGTQLVISGLHNLETWKGEKARRELVDRLTQLISPFAQSRPFRVFLTIGSETFDFEAVATQLRSTALSTHSFQWDGKSLRVWGRIKLNAVRGNDSADIFRIAVGNDVGEDFYRFLERQRKIPGVSREGSSWYVSYSTERDIRSIGGLATVRGDEQSTAIDDPGPFAGEIDQFGYREPDNVSNVFNKEASYKQYVKTHAGVRVYRDGFGIPPFGIGENDWLGLHRGQTSGGSFYGLRPRNTIGYVNISALKNARLVEKTDREGFSRTPASDNFFRLMAEVVEVINQTLENLRRAYNDYKRSREEDFIGFANPKALLHTVRSISAQARSIDIPAATTRMERAAQSVEELVVRLNTLPGRGGAEGEELRHVLQDTSSRIEEARAMLRQVQEYRDQSQNLARAADYLEQRVETLQSQLEEFSELAGLGMTAEAISHELYTWVDRMGVETRALTQTLRAHGSALPEIFVYTAQVRSGLSAIRRQLRHLAPSLRYARENVDIISTAAFFESSIKYYSRLARFTEFDIRLERKLPFEDFELRMNRGKLTQVIDNLVLNSAYWLAEGSRRGETTEPRIRIGSVRPRITVEDNGPGVDPSVESMLFQPFVTTKPKSVGRGLGLYISQQLLDSVGCEIALLPERNEHGRKYIFEIDFSGVLNG